MAAATATNGHAVASPKITLYTNHGCPYAHRAHITLEELKLPYEEVLIDLNTPRPQWYLDINPRGLVPSIKYSVEGVYDEEIVTESAVVAQFLMDSFPSHLLPGTREAPGAPLRRARLNFFVDTWSTKVGSNWFSIMLLDDGAEKDEKVDAWVATIEKELEPLLKDADPFFGGSKEFTLAEVIAAPFVLRFFLIAEDGEFLPKSLISKLEKLPNFSRWAQAVRSHPSALKTFPQEEILSGMRTRMAKMKAGAKGK
ncbi:hypothetical protein M409DRAFT_51803 [Zasmidium cellare ATCC 36951]|uniref:GST N-terminal domain-containing protein n=1 Tax=Zasmidium cellare ATCC 36951 TaxID=1080233 RepID=A0A6A6CSG5_ZASCE|nr:uncharacterized protein M409DRAFT_51803 [Zasmidium cellare ATCC 36951]KAF2170031.1 hypothetical protein M409DRAFT_51803 [Zasmidium cellare ATCC 36951]